MPELLQKVMLKIQNILITLQLKKKIVEKIQIKRKVFLEKASLTTFFMRKKLVEVLKKTYIVLKKKIQMIILKIVEKKLGKLLKKILIALKKKIQMMMEKIVEKKLKEVLKKIQIVLKKKIPIMVLKPMKKKIMRKKLVEVLKIS